MVHMLPSLRNLTLALVASISLGACTFGDASTVTPEPEFPTPSERASLPKFGGQTVTGARFESADVRGPAVIHWFASWCPECTREAADFARLQQEHPDLNYILVAVEDSVRAARAFMDEHEWDAESTLIDDHQRYTQAPFRLIGQPHTVFVDSAEKIVTTKRGVTSFTDFDSAATAAAMPVR